MEKYRGGNIMREILCFGDSNTYGYIPGHYEKAPARYPWGIRWTSLLNEKLGKEDYRVIEEGLCGRTTVFEDSFRAYRNGSEMLPAILETHQNVELVILMLGTNDCKAVYGTTPEIIGRGIEKLIRQLREYAPESQLLLVSPIHLGEDVWKSEYDPEFSMESVDISKGLQFSDILLPDLWKFPRIPWKFPKVWKQYIRELQIKKAFHFLRHLQWHSQVKQMKNIWTRKIMLYLHRQYIRK